MVTALLLYRFFLLSDLELALEIVASVHDIVNDRILRLNIKLEFLYIRNLVAGCLESFLSHSYRLIYLTKIEHTVKRN